MKTNTLLIVLFLTFSVTGFAQNQSTSSQKEATQKTPRINDAQSEKKIELKKQEQLSVIPLPSDQDPRAKLIRKEDQAIQESTTKSNH
jgi:hypothetical protein